MVEEPALFVPDGEAFVATGFSQSGWDPGDANGGAVLALLGHCLEDVPMLVPMSLSRLTVDLVRPVPLGRPLRIERSIPREGKKIQVVELRVTCAGIEHVRATALRLRRRDVRADGAPLPASTTQERPADQLTDPERSPTLSEVPPDRHGFLRSLDLRRGRLRDGSGFGYWVRLKIPVVADEAIRPTALLAFGLDFANLIGVEFDRRAVTLINPDVSAHVLRQPSVGWIGVVGDTRFDHTTGHGISTATLSDSSGVYAMASTSQLVQVLGDHPGRSPRGDQGRAHSSTGATDRAEGEERRPR